MKQAFLFTFFLSIATLVLAQEATTFVLVRHAEKANDGTKDPPLSQEGEVRAKELASLLLNQEITALYSTPYKRTRETLQPIADSKELDIIDYDPGAKGEWLAEIAEKHVGGTLVISGHSNTIPGLANALLGKQEFVQFDDSEYNNLILIVASEVGKGKLVRLNF